MTAGVPHNSLALAVERQPAEKLPALAAAAWQVREERDRLRVENARLRAELAAMRAGQLTLEVA